MITVVDMKNFLESSGWREVKESLQSRLEFMSAQLEDSGVYEEMLRYQGSIKEVRWLMDLPEGILEELESKKEE